ncbi:transposase [Streptomyces sp. NPDC006356]
MHEQVRLADDQAHAARTIWNCLHSWWTMLPQGKRTLAAADEAIRQGRKDLDYLGKLPAQAAQAVLKTYFQSWKNCWEGRADEPNYKGRFRSVMSVDVPQGRDLNIARVHRRWGVVNIPKVGRVRFRWTKDLPVGKRADKDNRITGARLVKDALGWHIAFRVQTLDRAPKPHRGPEIGIDAGVNIPLALSNEDHQDHGRPPRLPDGTADRDQVAERRREDQAAQPGAEGRTTQAAPQEGRAHQQSPAGCVRPDPSTPSESQATS